ncbi:hypothetical protein Pelo_12894 [Pelomyxa schiedti]|nr:hypothetical protein Pelo_12894 [Pelomyxa schiedti]
MDFTWKIGDIIQKIEDLCPNGDFNELKSALSGSEITIPRMSRLVVSLFITEVRSLQDSYSAENPSPKPPSKMNLDSLHTGLRVGWYNIEWSSSICIPNEDPQSVLSEAIAHLTAEDREIRGKLISLETKLQTLFHRKWQTMLEIEEFEISRLHKLCGVIAQYNRYYYEEEGRTCHTFTTDALKSLSVDIEQSQAKLYAFLSQTENNSTNNLSLISRAPLSQRDDMVALKWDDPAPVTVIGPNQLPLSAATVVDPHQQPQQRRPENNNDAL